MDTFKKRKTLRCNLNSDKAHIVTLLQGIGHWFDLHQSPVNLDQDSNGFSMSRNY